jgi:hypothetical protein
MNNNENKDEDGSHFRGIPIGNANLFKQRIASSTKSHFQGVPIAVDLHEFTLEFPTSYLSVCRVRWGSTSLGHAQPREARGDARA